MKKSGYQMILNIIIQTNHSDPLYLQISFPGDLLPRINPKENPKAIYQTDHISVKTQAFGTQLRIPVRRSIYSGHPESYHASTPASRTKAIPVITVFPSALFLEHAESKCLFNFFITNHLIEFYEVTLFFNTNRISFCRKM